MALVAVGDFGEDGGQEVVEEIRQVMSGVLPPALAAQQQQQRTPVSRKGKGALAALPPCPAPPRRVRDVLQTHIDGLLSLTELPFPSRRCRFSHSFFSEPRIAVFADREAHQTQIAIVFKRPAEPESTPRDYRRLVLQNLFSDVLSTRLFKISRREQPAFFGADVRPPR